jgi:hypothetical protein
MARGESAGSPSSNIAPPVSTTASSGSASRPTARRRSRMSAIAATPLSTSPAVAIQPAPSFAVKLRARGPEAAT